MKKSFFILLVIISFSVVIFSQEVGKDKEKKDPYKPTPEDNYQTGLISISGNLGAVINSMENWSSSTPTIKITVFYNFNENTSIGIGGGASKSNGPNEFIIGEEGYSLDPSFIVMLEPDYSFTNAKVEESWYSAQLLFKLPNSFLTPYAFAGAKYLSVTYDQQLSFRYLGETKLLSLNLYASLTELAFFVGGGLSAEIMDFIDILFEAEYTTIATSSIFSDKLAITVGFKFNI